MILSARDMTRLQGVHPDLVKIVRLAAEMSVGQWMVIEGVRTLAKQKEYFAAGKSKTLRSRHLNGHAVDLAPLIDLDGDGDLDVSWNARDFKPIVSAMNLAALRLGLPIESGGDWKSFVDLPHWQLPWGTHP